MWLWWKYIKKREYYETLTFLVSNVSCLIGEQLEWIVIVLIGFEIVIGLITIAQDAFSYSHRR